LIKEEDPDSGLKRKIDEIVKKEEDPTSKESFE